MKAKRYMMNPATERRLINGALWLVVACVLVILLTSCSSFDPYAGLQVPTLTPAPLTVRSAEVPTRDERWEFHNLGDWTLNPTAQNHKAGH